jgi:phage shock protein A
MPSREEVSQLAQQMHHIETRIDDVNAKSDEIGQALHDRLTLTSQSELNGEHTPALAYTQYAQKTHVEALHTSLDKMWHLLQEHLPQMDRLDALEARIQALDVKLDRIMQHLSAQSVSATPTETTRSTSLSRTSSLEAHMHALDDKAEKLLALIDSIKDVPGPEQH